MIKPQYSRTTMLIGEQAFLRLKKSRVIVFGIGGVGGFVTEALARAGIGTLGIVDFDRVDITNLNRQIIALHSTVGRLKTEVMEERIAEIDPGIAVRAFPLRVTEDTIEDFCLADWDYVVDAIDDVAAKLMLIQKAKERGKPVISSMGTGNKLDPSKFQIADIEKTHTCPLARTMRREISKMGLKKVKVLFSPEQPTRADDKKTPTASISFVPASAGLLIASEVVKDILVNIHCLSF